MTTRELVRERISSHRVELDRFGVRRLSIFGSVVRGDDRADSDVDILVEFTDAAKQADYFGRFMDVAFYLENLLGRKVDLATPAMVRRIKADIIEETILA
jgi:uncharacterized protein